MAWEPRIPSPCGLKAMTHFTGSKIGSSRSRSNRGTEYYRVGMNTHIEYPDIFFWNIKVLSTLKWPPMFSSIYYELVTLLHPPNRLGSDETEEFFAQTCSTCLEGPYRKDSSGVHPCRMIDRAWEPRIPFPCILKAITHATGSKSGVLGPIGIWAQNTTL